MTPLKLADSVYTRLNFSTNLYDRVCSQRAINRMIDSALRHSGGIVYLPAQHPCTVKNRGKLPATAAHAPFAGLCAGIGARTGMQRCVPVASLSAAAMLLPQSIVKHAWAAPLRPALPMMQPMGIGWLEYVFGTGFEDSMGVLKTPLSYLRPPTQSHERFKVDGIFGRGERWLDTTSCALASRGTVLASAGALGVRLGAIAVRIALQAIRMGVALLLVPEVVMGGALGLGLTLMAHAVYAVPLSARWCAIKAGVAKPIDGPLWCSTKTYWSMQHQTLRPLASDNVREQWGRS